MYSTHIVSPLITELFSDNNVFFLFFAQSKLKIQLHPYLMNWLLQKYHNLIKLLLPNVDQHAAVMHMYNISDQHAAVNAHV